MSAEVAEVPLTRPGRPPSRPLADATTIVEPSPTKGLSPAVIAKVLASGMRAIALAMPARRLRVVESTKLRRRCRSSTAAAPPPLPLFSLPKDVARVGHLACGAVAFPAHRRGAFKIFPTRCHRVVGAFRDRNRFSPPAEVMPARKISISDITRGTMPLCIAQGYVES